MRQAPCPGCGKTVSITMRGKVHGAHKCGQPGQRGVAPRGICPHCDRAAALMSDGRITGSHGPCPGAGQLPKALAEKQGSPAKPKRSRRPAS